MMREKCTHAVDLLVVAARGADAQLGVVVRVDEAELVAVGEDLELDAARRRGASTPLLAHGSKVQREGTHLYL